MIRLLLRRLGQGVLVVFVLETITFFLVRMLPGNPFLGERKLPEHIMQQLQSLYGLEESAWGQYWNYWKNILLHGDFGPSLIREGVRSRYPSCWGYWVWPLRWPWVSRPECFPLIIATAGRMRCCCVWRWRESVFPLSSWLRCSG